MTFFSSSDTVRKTAYEILAEKIHIKALSIASRLQLINEGLNDRSGMSHAGLYLYIVSAEYCISNYSAYYLFLGKF